MDQQPRHRQAAPRTSRLAQSLVGVALLAVVAVATTGFSSATFTSSSAATSTVTAAADWTPPTVTAGSPAATVSGSVTLTASATDADSGVKDVAIQYRVADGATWTTVCTDAASPYSCTWDTTAVSDGTYDVRAVATDNAGNATTSVTARTTVANALVVTLASPGDIVRGARTLSATVTGPGSPQVRIEHQAVGSTTWTTACTAAAAPYDCSWVTTGVANGSYDLRAVAVSGGTSYASATVRTLVDNLAPTVTMTDPGTPLTGTKTFTATATDAHSGVAQVAIQYATGSTWTTLCTVTSAPYSCSYDTTSLPNGTYGFRAVATDRAGNATTSTVVAGRAVSNVVSTVSLNDPGTYLRGTATLTATASSTGTIASVRIQRSVAGAAVWTDVCTDTTTPYTCSLATATLTDGAYDLRAVLTDSTGRVTTSTVIGSRIVDNTAGRGVDVQTTNGTGVNGRIDAGDTIAFTFSERLNLATVLAGWDGSATAVTVRVRDGLLISLNPNNDVLDVTGVNLGSVAMGDSFANILSTITVDATMTASTATVGGVQRTVVTLRIDGTAGTTSAATGIMTWTPSASVTDLAGNPLLTTAVTESGGTDRDF